MRAPLVSCLTDVHARQPLLPDNPRDAVARVDAHLDRFGVVAVRIRGTVSLSGVEVDHVWLAARVGDGLPWVLDPAFPLHAPAFIACLAGYVAGTTTRSRLAEIAALTRIEDRVIGEVPIAAVYRGSPYWGRSVN